MKTTFEQAEKSAAGSVIGQSKAGWLLSTANMGGTAALPSLDFVKGYFFRRELCEFYTTMRQLKLKME